MPFIDEPYSLRPAAAKDAATIRHMISVMNLNPLALDWKRFVLAVDRDGQTIGCGQVKPHSDGSHELASIAVLPDWRGKGIARRIIERLLAEHPGTLYLTCRNELGPLYEKFGFVALDYADMPPYFKRLSRLVRLFNRLGNQPNRLLVMRKN